MQFLTAVVRENKCVWFSNFYCICSGTMFHCGARLYAPQIREELCQQRVLWRSRLVVLTFSNTAYLLWPQALSHHQGPNALMTRSFQGWSPLLVQVSTGSFIVRWEKTCGIRITNGIQKPQILKLSAKGSWENGSHNTRSLIEWGSMSLHIELCWAVLSVQQRASGTIYL